MSSTCLQKWDRPWRPRSSSAALASSRDHDSISQRQKIKTIYLGMQKKHQKTCPENKSLPISLAFQTRKFRPWAFQQTVEEYGINSQEIRSKIIKTMGESKPEEKKETGIPPGATVLATTTTTTAVTTTATSAWGGEVRFIMESLSDNVDRFHLLWPNDLICGYVRKGLYSGFVHFSFTFLINISRQIS